MYIVQCILYINAKKTAIGKRDIAQFSPTPYIQMDPEKQAIMGELESTKRRAQKQQNKLVSRIGELIIVPNTVDS